MKCLRSGRPVTPGSLKDYPDLTEAVGPATWDVAPGDLGLLNKSNHHPVALALAAGSLVRVPRSVRPPALRTIRLLTRRDIESTGLPVATLNLIIAEAGLRLERLASKGLLRSRGISQYLPAETVIRRCGVDFSRKQIRGISEEDRITALKWLIAITGMDKRPPPGIELPTLRPFLTLSSLLNDDPKVPDADRVLIMRVAERVVEAVRSWSESGVVVNDGA